MKNQTTLTIGFILGLLGIFAVSCAQNSRLVNGRHYRAPQQKPPISKKFQIADSVTDDEGNPAGMVLIPGGSFEMGIDEKDLEALVKLAHDIPHIGINLARVFWSNEMPKHTVELNSFYLDTHEVTNAQFKQFVQETRYEAQGKWQKYAGEDRANHPVVNVSWFDAKAYAEWSGKRLPNEAEWEYAARGGKDVKWWPWGNEEDPLKANYQRKRETFFTGIPRVIGVKKKINTKRVGNYEPNGYGLYDIIGNVEEWCEDEFKSYPGGPSIRPLRGEKPGPKKAIRGGSWITKHPAYMRITKRHRTRPDGFNYSLGFRCAKSMK